MSAVLGRYVVMFQRPNLGVEERDGGTTLTEARAEGCHIVQNTPSTVPVSIYLRAPTMVRLQLVEVLRVPNPIVVAGHRRLTVLKEASS